MSCEWEDDVTAYLHGALSEERREAFEDHYLACSTCFELLQAADAVRAGLAPVGIPASPFVPRRVRRLPFLGGLAAAAGVAFAIWVARAPEAPIGPVAPTPQVSAASTGTSPPPAASDAARRAALSRLSDVDPPRFVPLLTRGAGSSDAFESGMQRYVAGDYRRAVPLLRRAAEADRSSRTLLFLGVSELLSGDAAAAVRTLSRGRDLGGSLSEDAALLLAKAQFRAGDPTGSRRTLETLSSSSRAAEATLLLDALDSLEPAAAR